MRSNEGISVSDLLNCVLCGEEGVVQYAELRDRYFGVSGQWSFMRCPKCGHLWLNPSPDTTDTSKLYSSYYTHKQNSETGGYFLRDFRAAMKRGLLFAAGCKGTAPSKREVGLGKILYLIPTLREAIHKSVMFLNRLPPGRLLDVGCGSGTFLQQMQSLGWDVTGLEPDIATAKWAQDLHGFPVMTAPIEEAELPDEYYDVITMSHVIEHVHNPMRVLRLCHRALKPGGLLVVTTPHVDSWGHRLFRESWMHLDPPRHLHLFSVQNLRISVKKTGFLTKSVFTFSHGAYKVYDVSRAIQKRGVADLLSLTVRPTLRAYLFQLAEYALRLLDQNAGEEIVIIATKPQV